MRFLLLPLAFAALVLGCSPQQLAPNKMLHCSDPQQQRFQPIDTAQVDATTPWSVYFLGTNGLAAVIDIGDIEIVIDGGYRSDEDLVEFISQHQVVGPQEAIELVVLTHPDIDHWSGLSPLLRRFEWKDFWHSGYWPDTGLDTDGMETFRRDVLQRYPRPPLECRIPPATTVAGRQLVLDGWRFQPAYRVAPFSGAPDLIIEVLHTDSCPETQNTIAGSPRDAYLRNNASIVLRITLPQGQTFLFTGDINGHVRGYTWEPAEIEAQLLHAQKQGVSLHADVMQIPHHGVPTSASPGFLHAVQPEWAVFPAHSLFPGYWSRDRVLSELSETAQALSTNGFFGEARHNIQCHAPDGVLRCDMMDDIEGTAAKAPEMCAQP